MATVAGYTICFVSDGVVRQITMAANEHEIELLIEAQFGDFLILSRAPLDAVSLGLLQLKSGEWMEWVARAR